MAAVLAAGCAAQQGSPTPNREPQPVAAATATRGTRPPAPSAPEPAADWESFARTGEALRQEIDEQAEALGTGPIGNRAQQLASLRLAATGRDLVLAGSADGALAALEKAVSLYGANGYAYLFLAWVHQGEGRRDQAREFAASARRYLPPDEGVQSELEGLARSLDGAR